MKQTMMQGFKVHILKKYRRFQQEISAELRTMIRAKGGSIKVYYKDYKEICLDDDNNVIFKMMFNKYTIEDMNLDDVFQIIASIEQH